MTTTYGVVIIGSGFSGLGLAIALKKAGMRDFVILEKADEVGGTWRENTYPGCACDIRSHLYSYSFELKPDWSRAFAPGAEILGYIKHCTAKYGLREHLRFGAEVVGAEYDEGAAMWQVTLAGGAAVRGRVLVAGTGPLHRPNVPELPGLERFEGRAFHSAEWDHDYDLTGRRVAVIGTGASAIQFVPRIAERTTHLTVFQRTPPWVLPKPDRRFSDARKRIFRAMPVVQRAYRDLLFWQQESLVLGFAHPWLFKSAERLGRRYLDRQLHDPVLRRKMRPGYTLGCKRVLISNDYFPTFNRPDVDLVTDGVAEVREKSVITDTGAEIEVDAIIFGTGFSVTDAVDHTRIVGRDGVRIQDAWRDGIQAHLGTMVAGFPSMFLMIGPNTGLGHNSMIFMIESQIRYIMQCLRLMSRRRARSIEVRSDVQARHNAWVQDRSKGFVWVSGGCKSWYLDGNGVNRAAWPASAINFWLRTRRIDPGDFRLEPAAQTRPGRRMGAAR